MSACMNNFVSHAQQEGTNSFQIDQLSSYPKRELPFGGWNRRPCYGRVHKANTAVHRLSAILLENDGLTELQSTQSDSGRR